MSKYVDDAVEDDRDGENEEEEVDRVASPSPLVHAPKPFAIARTETVTTDGILATSPESRLRKQALNRPAHPRFDTTRRASYPPNKHEATALGDHESPLQRIYSRGVDGRRASFDSQGPRVLVDAEPAWARELMGMVRRLEEKQANIEAIIRIHGGA
jgi:hypothetical protein